MTDDERALEKLAARRWRVAIGLTIAMVVTYFGFLFLVAYAKPIAGALVIVVAWIVTGIYVVWANKHYDPELERLRQTGVGKGAS